MSRTYRFTEYDKLISCKDRQDKRRKRQAAMMTRDAIMRAGQLVDNDRARA